MQVIRSLLVAWCAALMACSAMAQVQQSQGKASVAYKAKAATPEARLEAQRAAQINALEFLAAEGGTAQAGNLDILRNRVAQNPSRYILSSTVLAEDDDPKLQQVTVTVRVSVNVANLRNDLHGPAVPRGERQTIALLIVSRQVDSSTRFDNEVSTTATVRDKGDRAASTAHKGSETEKIRGGRIDTSENEKQRDSYDVQRTVTTRTGGQTVRRAATSTWRILPSADLNQTFTSVFARSGYRVAEAAFLGPRSGGLFKLSQVQADYRSGQDLQEETLANTVEGMRNAKVPFLAIGTMDMGLADQDAATGLMRVTVTVNARILDISGDVPETVASSTSKAYAGTGPTEDEARIGALKLAGASAAQELSAQLANLNLH